MGKKKSRKEKQVEEYVTTNPFEGTLQTVIDPRLFRSIEQICNMAISVSGNSADMRNLLAAFSMEMRLQALARFGHLTPDTAAMSNLLKRTDPNRPTGPLHPPRRDPLDILEGRRALDPTQLSAAILIRDVWRSFGRLLMISGKGYDRAGGSTRRAVALQPLDVMGQDIWESYNKYYIPWHEKAKLRYTFRAKSGKVQNTEIVFRVLVEEYFPAEVDRQWGLDDGSAQATLKKELSRFFDPFGTDSEAAAA